jgi:hypothetical protein
MHPDIKRLVFLIFDPKFLKSILAIHPNFPNPGKLPKTQFLFFYYNLFSYNCLSKNFCKKPKFSRPPARIIVYILYKLSGKYIYNPRNFPVPALAQNFAQIFFSFYAFLFSISLLLILIP